MNQLISEIKVIETQDFMGMEIPVIEGGFGLDSKVILAKTIADIHDMELKNVNKLINNNIEEFEFGIDIIDLKTNGDFKEPLEKLGFSNRDITISKNIYLLSEQGYMLLVGFMKTEKAKEIRKELRREYFSMRKALKEIVPTLTEKQQLATQIVLGGSAALKAYERLAEIERKEVEEREEEKRRLLQLEHKEEMQKERKSRNELLQATTVVELLRDRLNLPRLTTTLLNMWLAKEKGLGEYVKLEGDKKRRFIPNETFLSWVSIEGYSFTGKTIDGKGTHVKYSYAMIDRIIEHHSDSLMRYVNDSILNKITVVDAI